MTEEEIHKVFVYGTLRTGGSNAFRMRGAHSLGAATLKARLYRVHEQFPGVVLSEKEDAVLVGEVFSGVTEDLLQQLDLYEGCDAAMPEQHRIYRRVKVAAQLEGEDFSGRENQQSVPCWVWEYIKPVSEGRRIKSGDWLCHLAENS